MRRQPRCASQRQQERHLGAHLRLAYSRSWLASRSSACTSPSSTAKGHRWHLAINRLDKLYGGVNSASRAEWFGMSAALIATTSSLIALLRQVRSNQFSSAVLPLPRGGDQRHVVQRGSAANQVWQA